MADSKDPDGQLFDELVQRHGGSGLVTGLRYFPFEQQGVSAVILEMGLPPLPSGVFSQIQDRMARSTSRDTPIFLMDTHLLRHLLREREIASAQINQREFVDLLKEQYAD